jgi:trigger factor
LPKYQKIAVEPQEAAVTEEELDEYVERMRSAFAKFEEAPEGYIIQANDLVCMDYKGTVDDKPVKDIDPAAEPISGKNDFWVQVDESQFVPEVVKAMVGIKAGSEETVNFKFLKTMPIEALRGQKAVYELKIKSVRKRITPTDAELCEQVKVDTLDAFREDARKKMLETAEQKEIARRKQLVTEHLLKKATFDVPESELSEAVNNILDQMMREAQYRGVKPEEMANQREEILKNATVSASSQVRMKYIIREIAHKEDITASKEEVDAKIESMAKEYNMAVSEIRKRIVENGNQKVLDDQVIFDKTIEMLVADAK